MQKTKSALVMPGDFIGTSEEFLNGAGTYEKAGNIYAANIGVIDIDTKEMSASVIPRTDTPSVPKVGDVVIGRVSDLKGSVALVDIARIKGHENRELATSDRGAIHISNIKNAYVKDLSHEFGFMDIVLGKVIDAKTLRLSTDGKDLGVIKAICSRCRIMLKREDDTLKCPECEHIETRKIAEGYGTGVI